MQDKQEISKELKEELNLQEVEINVDGEKAPEPKTAKEEDQLRQAAFQYQLVLDQSSGQIMNLLKDKIGTRKRKQAAAVIESSLRSFAEIALRMTEAYVKTKNIGELEQYIGNIQGYMQGKWLIDIDPVKATKKEIKEAKSEYIDFNANIEEEASEGLKVAEGEIHQEVEAEKTDEDSN